MVVLETNHCDLQSPLEWIQGQTRFQWRVGLETVEQAEPPLQF